jgi:hypothetical protein
MSGHLQVFTVHIQRFSDRHRVLFWFDVAIYLAVLHDLLLHMLQSATEPSADVHIREQDRLAIEAQQIMKLGLACLLKPPIEETSTLIATMREATNVLGKEPLMGPVLCKQG